MNVGPVAFGIGPSHYEEPVALEACEAVRGKREGRAAAVAGADLPECVATIRRGRAASGCRDEGGRHDHHGYPDWKCHWSNCHWSLSGFAQVAGRAWPLTFVSHLTRVEPLQPVIIDRIAVILVGRGSLESEASEHGASSGAFNHPHLIAHSRATTLCTAPPEVAISLLQLRKLENRGTHSREAHPGVERRSVDCASSDVLANGHVGGAGELDIAQGIAE